MLNWVADYYISQIGLCKIWIQRAGLIPTNHSVTCLSKHFILYEAQAIDNVFLLFLTLGLLDPYFSLWLPFKFCCIMPCFPEERIPFTKLLVWNCCKYFCNFDFSVKGGWHGNCSHDSCQYHGSGTCGICSCGHCWRLVNGTHISDCKKYPLHPWSGCC